MTYEQGQDSLRRQSAFRPPQEPPLLEQPFTPPSVESDVSFPDRKQILFDYRKHVEAAKEAARLRKEGDASQEKADIKIRTNLPFVLIVGLGDLHIGSEHCNYDLLDKYINTIADTPGVYTFTIGDERDNFVIKKYPSGLFEGVLNPQQQAAMAEAVFLKLEEKNKLLARISGNHDNWTWTECGVQLYNFWQNELKSPLLRVGGFVHLDLNDVKYVGFLHHGQSVFNSNFNPNHASKRAFEFQGPYDFMFSGHTHVSETAHSFRWSDEFQKDYVQVRTGTFKSNDPYAKALQLGRGQAPGECILFSTTEKRMMPFLRLEDGVEALQAMNTLSQLIAQGLLGVR